MKIPSLGTFAGDVTRRATNRVLRHFADRASKEDSTDEPAAEPDQAPRLQAGAKLSLPLDRILGDGSTKLVVSGFSLRLRKVSLKKEEND
ncbi:hypothetical protein HN748_05345 [Candidatus Peregrinibacteria bacterium]|jgi:hypothetical protein|nr:hypothetical protein [Candidatus Peregrinibacteria bacterium]MBT7703633.1 hypothetical protein [Candidatus Peregrinibacteria bacterium]